MVEQQSKPIKEQRVCVIGGGPSGTAVCRSFKSAADKGIEIPQIHCFEKQSALGGQWNYNHRVGLDEHNNPVHSGMYRYLFSNGPKECLEFADYSFKEHFGTNIPSYPPREVLEHYIKGRIEKSNIQDWIHLNTIVHDVRFHAETNDFEVVIRKQTTVGIETTVEERTERFDYVLTCTGHFHVPNVPYFEGIEKFAGRVLHSHDFRDALEFSNQRIMVIGSSYSAEDIASQCYKYGCRDITCSYRTNPMGFHWPEGFETRPLLTKIDGKMCTFKDGSTKEIDAIILCTGYKKHFPFLQQDLQLKSSNRLWIDNCYKGIFYEKNPKLMYIGMQDQWYTFNMFDAQAWYARDHILGNIKLPSKEEQTADFNEWRAKEAVLESDEDCIRFQVNYIKMLNESTDYPKFDYEKTVQEFLKWEDNKHDNIMTFRDKSHKSAMTGDISPEHHTPWIEALDDSMKTYMGKPKAE